MVQILLFWQKLTIRTEPVPIEKKKKVFYLDLRAIGYKNAQGMNGLEMIGMLTPKTAYDALFNIAIKKPQKP